MRREEEASSGPGAPSSGGGAAASAASGAAGNGHAAAQVRTVPSQSAELDVRPRVSLQTASVHLQHATLPGRTAHTTWAGLPRP